MDAKTHLDVPVDVLELKRHCVLTRRWDVDAQPVRSNIDGWTVDGRFAIRVLVEHWRAVGCRVGNLERKVGTDSPRVSR